MFAFRFLKPSLQHLLKPGCSSTCISRLLNYTPFEYGHHERDPATLFFSPEIQSLLKSLTRIDLQKVYRMRKLGNKQLEPPIYKFMTSEELENLLKEAHEKVNELLQMPPVVRLNNPIDHVVSSDPELKGLNTCRLVFTDVTFGVRDCDRLIVVREPDGDLKHADWELRHRMNQVYFPKLCRHIITPAMFAKDEYLESLLDRNEYEFVLDRACVQFEPYEPAYQKVTSLTYQHLNGKSAFDNLRSTRHFGPLAFFLVWFKNLDNLLLELIQTSHIIEANQLIELFSKVHDKNIMVSDHAKTDAIKEFIEKESQKKALLELAVQAYHDSEKQRIEYEKGLQVAHGLSL